MKENNITLASTTVVEELELEPNMLYLVDFSKLESVNDLIIILSTMGIGFPSNHPHINLLKPFLNLNKPIPTNQPSQEPPKKEIKLPKLNTL
jgi:hypothetical protein